MRIKVFSFFAGCGLLDLGFEDAGYDFVMADEISPAFMNAYKYSLGIMGHGLPEMGCITEDINEFSGARSSQLRESLREIHRDSDIAGFIGGPPCPDFSVAGKQKGMDGDNGRLSLSYVSLIAEQRPDFFLFENVKGLVSTSKHRRFYDELKNILGNAGYIMSDTLANALRFGVPQYRERVMLFGVHRSLAGNASFDWYKYAQYTPGEILSAAWPGVSKFQESATNTQQCPPGVIEALTVQHWFSRNNVEHHPNAGDYFTPRAGLTRMLAVDEGDDSRKSYKRLHRWRYSPTAAYGNNEVHLHPYKARRLSVSEVLAIQSMPENFCLPPGMTLSDKFKTLGNGVPYLMAYGVARAVKDFLMGAVK